MNIRKKKKINQTENNEEVEGLSVEEEMSEEKEDLGGENNNQDLLQKTNMESHERIYSQDESKMLNSRNQHFNNGSNLTLGQQSESLNINSQENKNVPIGYQEFLNPINSKYRTVGNSIKSTPIENFGKIKNKIQEILSKINYLETQKNKEENFKKIVEIDKEIVILKNSLLKYQKFFNQFKNMIYSQNENNQLNSIDLNTANFNKKKNKTEKDSEIYYSAKSRSQVQTKELGSLKNGRKISVNDHISTSFNYSEDNSSKIDNKILYSNQKVKGFLSTNKNIIPQNVIKNSSQNFMNLISYNKSGVSSISLTNNINTKPQTIMTSKPNPNIKSNHYLSNNNTFLINSPSTKTSFYESNHLMYNVSDKNERILNKRKLYELMNFIGANLIDSKIIIDNDAIEILSDLVDEFITSVTNFACKIAKHKKVKSVDIRDFQLHLERNWNIKIPGFFNDEIRSIPRRDQSESYSEKILRINSSKNNHNTNN